MRVVSSRQVRLGLLPPDGGLIPGIPFLGEGAAEPELEDQINVRVKPSAAAAGLGFLVLAGVVTHVAVRVVDRWFFR